MNLADFDTLFDLLEHPVHIIHYIQRRTEIEGVFKFIGDEIDLMGLYIDTLLNIDHLCLNDHQEYFISGMSLPIDKYYASKDQGILIKKPKPKNCDLFQKIIVQLEERSLHRWTEMGCFLNRFLPSDQMKATRAVKSLTKVVKKNWSIEGHKNIVLYCPPEYSEYALAIVLFNDRNREKRYEFIEHAQSLCLEPKQVKFGLVIAKNIDQPEKAYHYISIFEKAEDEN